MCTNSRFKMFAWPSGYNAATAKPEQMERARTGPIAQYFDVEIEGTNQQAA